MEENNSQLELIMSDLDEEDEDEGIRVEERATNHFQHSFLRSGQQALRNICLMVTAALFIFAFGTYLYTMKQVTESQVQSP